MARGRVWPYFHSGGKGVERQEGQLQLVQVPVPRQISRYSVQAVSGSGAWMICSAIGSPLQMPAQV